MGAPLHRLPGADREGQAGSLSLNRAALAGESSYNLNFPISRDLPPRLLSRLADGLVNLLFPDACFFCHAPVVRLQECGLCSRCWQGALRCRINPPKCACCGIPVPEPFGADPPICGPCVLDPPPFSGARSFGYYRAELAAIIRQLKFFHRRNLAHLLVPLVAEAFGEGWQRREISLLTAVPLHRRRERERGYNQAALLAGALSKALGIPFHGRILVRIRDTPPQVGLSQPQRRENLRGAFRCRDTRAVAGQSVLLLDDVMTTGATVRSASAALMEAGARRVQVLTVARAVPGIE